MSISRVVLSSGRAARNGGKVCINLQYTLTVLRKPTKKMDSRLITLRLIFLRDQLVFFHPLH